MIGSGTENDPWVPLTAAEFKDCWSNRGGYIDLTCDIDMELMTLGDPKVSPPVILDLKGFGLRINKLVHLNASYVLAGYENGFKVINGVIHVSNDRDSIFYLSWGDTKESKIIDVIIVNHSNYTCHVTKEKGGVRRNIVCINMSCNLTSIDRYSCVYQNSLPSAKFYKVGQAKVSDIYESGLPAETFYVESYLDGNNLCIAKKGKSFVSGFTMHNGVPEKMEVTVIGTASSARWSGRSGNFGEFEINLGSYSDPVSVFSTDIINKKLRSNNAYSAGDVAIPFPDAGIKFTCTVSGVTSELPNPLPTTGTVTLGTAVFEVKNISPSSCAGPMIPANKYSNYGVKSK